MRSLSRIVQDWRDRLMPPPTGRHAAARIRPYVTETPAAPAPRREPTPTEPIPTAPLHQRRRIVHPWAPAAEITPPPAPVPHGDGLDDLRDAVLRLTAARPDLGHPAPAQGAKHKLTGAAR